MNCLRTIDRAACAMRRRAVLASALALLPLFASAQAPAPSAPQRFTLATAIDAAIRNYPRVRAAIAQQHAAAAGVGVARTAYLPRTDVLWQTNRATANNVYGLMLPQSIIPSISGPVLPADNTRAAWSSAGGVLLSW